MLQFVKAGDVIHSLLKLIALIVVVDWARSELGELVKTWAWDTPDKKVRTVGVTLAALLMLYAALYSQAVPW